MALVKFKDKDGNIISIAGIVGPQGPAGPKGETGPAGSNGVTSINGQTGDVTLTVPDAVTESTISGWGFTKNTGTLTTDSTLDATKLSGTIPSSCYTVPVQSVNGQTGTVSISVPTVTDTYSATSTNAMSGKAVASAISGITHPVSSVNGKTGAVSISVPTITSGTTDLEAGTSPLATGAIYLVYEEE